jgi:Tfp pilus assembly protein PilX
MRRFLRNLYTDRRGIALVTVLALMGILSVLAAAYTLSIRADVALRGGAARERSGFYAAEAGLNSAMAEVNQYYNNYTSPGSYSTTMTVGSGSHARTVTYSVAAVPGHNPEAPTLIPAGQPFAGLNTIRYQYTVSSVAKNAANDQEAALGAQFTMNTVPIFQFLAFYQNDLEILPGPNMVLSGRIHTNSNLYLSAGDTLSIADRPTATSTSAANPFVQISSVGDIYRGRKDSTACDGTIYIDMQQDANAADPGLDALSLPCVGTTTSLVSPTTRNSFLGSLLANVDTLKVPDVSTFARGDAGAGVTGGAFWQNADLRIVLNLSNSRLTSFCGEPLPHSGGANGLYPIEVQNSDGTVNAAKTTALYQFICERRGAIFYNDIPSDVPADAAMPLTSVSPNGSGSNQDPSNFNNYTPHFDDDVSVYRRIGEDTNGDGIVDTDGDGLIENDDTNYDICPIVIGTTLGTRPAWRPDYCDAKFGQWGAAGSHNLFANQATAKTWLISQSLASWFVNNDYRRGGFYNWREHKWVMMLNVNVRALVDWNEAHNNALFNAADVSNGGIVLFLSVKASDATTTPLANTHRYGVRIFDSANLNTRGGTFVRPNSADPTGLTVVSDQAVYVQGNYNYYPSMTLSTKLPAAVLGDTLNVLSQSWEVPVIVDKNKDIQYQYNNDRKTGGSLAAARNLQPADGYFIKGNVTLQCPTSPCPQFTGVATFGINAAFLAGVDVTTVGHYNGGLENYPRFHEDWSPGGTQRALNYRGSFVSLGTPQYANGEWCGTGATCNIYDPPARNWDYDASFNDANFLPPLTPQVNLLRQQLFTRFYQ